MKNKIIVMLVCMFAISLVSAVPQVIFTSVNMTINNGNFSLQGEGINAQDTFPVIGNCSFNYNRQNIPITFSRDIGENSTDVAVLIKALSENQNISDDWKKCITENSMLNATLTQYNNQGLSLSEYTQCKTDVTTCNANIQTMNANNSAASKELDEIKQQRMFLIIGLAILGYGCYYFWNKTKIKPARSPLDGIPSDIKV